MSCECSVQSHSNCTQPSLPVPEVFTKIPWEIANWATRIAICSKGMSSKDLHHQWSAGDWAGCVFSAFILWTYCLTSAHAAWLHHPFQKNNPSPKSCSQVCLSARLPECYFAIKINKPNSPNFCRMKHWIDETMGCWAFCLVVMMMQQNSCVQEPDPTPPSCSFSFQEHI